MADTRPCTGFPGCRSSVAVLDEKAELLAFGWEGLALSVLVLLELPGSGPAGGLGSAKITGLVQGPGLQREASVCRAAPLANEAQTRPHCRERVAGGASGHGEGSGLRAGGAE